jgi:hypothetical protein
LGLNECQISRSQIKLNSLLLVEVGLRGSDKVGKRREVAFLSSFSHSPLESFIFSWPFGLQLEIVSSMTHVLGRAVPEKYCGYFEERQACLSWFLSLLVM